MPELQALGVERKGESACENAGGLDFWRLFTPGCQHTHLWVLFLLHYTSSVHQHLMFFTSLVLVSGESVVDLQCMDATIAFVNPVRGLHWCASSWIWVLLLGGHPTFLVVMVTSLRM